MPKEKIYGIASCGIICNGKNPSDLFLEIKDDGHPKKSHRRKLCFVGGNWSGEEAAKDQNTLDTFKREFNEEFSLDKRIRPPYHLRDIKKLDKLLVADSSPKNFEIMPEFLSMFDNLRGRLPSRTRPFCDFINLFRDDGKDYRYLISYYVLLIDPSLWHDLWAFQDIFGNLSNESISVKTTLKEIIESQTQFISGHGHVLQKFLLGMGFKEAEKLPLEPGVQVTPVGPPLPTYHDYLAKYDITHTPFTS